MNKYLYWDTTEIMESKYYQIKYTVRDPYWGLRTALDCTVYNDKDTAEKIAAERLNGKVLEQTRRELVIHHHRKLNPSWRG